MGNPAKPEFVILACLIQVWDDTSGSTEDLKLSYQPVDPIMLTEVVDIEINESYQKLFSTAKVAFPRGAIYRRAVTSFNVDDASRKITADVEQSGVVITKRTNTERLETSTFKNGQRIRIYLGYIDDPAIANTAKTDTLGRTIYNDMSVRAKYIEAMSPKANPNSSALMFDGYITKVSIDEPIILECEDLAHTLKLINCPNTSPKKDYTVQDFLAEDGEFNMLRKSGIKLHPKTDNINIGAISLNNDLTVADMLGNWAQRARLYSFIRYYNGEPCLYVGRSYFSIVSDKDNILDLREHPLEIDFGYNVAENGLKMMDTDKKFLAVEATCWDTSTIKGKQYHITVRLNPEYDKTQQGRKYQILNETTLSKAAMQAGATVLSKSKDKVDLSSYTIIPYTSTRRNISHEELQAEAIKYFENYNMNGIEGTLTLFGDFNIQSGTKVHLTDKRFSVKNGYYLVDEVTTRFGVNGYRQTIKMPYCISRDKPSEEK